MNDKEFIELLNLYVDREITVDDARRLEAEVESNSDRRKVYDQYCKIQKACSMLSVDLTPESAGAGRRPESYSGLPSHWTSPFVVALAAAACVAVVITRHNRALEAARAEPASAVASDAPAVRSIADTLDLSSESDGMKPVFFARLPASQPSQRAMFLASDASSQATRLNWINDVHLTPVFDSSDSQFLLAPKPDLKASVLSDAQAVRDLQEPSEMTAFRFQR